MQEMKISHGQKKSRPKTEKAARKQAEQKKQDANMQKLLNKLR